MTVNLGGTVFNIDDDAYRLLDNYLNNLRHHFRKEVGADEIVDDIERRISELFTERCTAGRQVITLADVEMVIARMGKPEEMEQDDAESAAPNPEEQQTASVPRRRLFRDPDDKILGGVFGGIAAYFEVDAALLRLLMFVLLLTTSGFMIPAYILCWIFIPLARTAADKLSMRGEAVTVENIGRTVTDGFERVSNGVNDYVRSGKPRTFLQKLCDVLVTLVGWMLKIVLIALAIICSPILLAVALAFVALLFAAVVVLIGGGAALISLFPMYDMVLPFSPLPVIVMCISGILLVAIPLIAIVWAIFRQVFNWQPMSAGLKWTLLVLWLVSATCFGICLVMQGPELPLMMELFNA